jgi:hypothetical protein
MSVLKFGVVFSLILICLLTLYVVSVRATVHFEHRFDGSYLTLVENHMDIPSYPEFTAGQVQHGEVTAYREHRDANGNLVKSFNYRLRGSLADNIGERSYTYIDAEKKIIADIVSSTETLKEHNTVRWVFQQQGAQVFVSISGARELPILFYPFVWFHNTNALNMLKRMAQINET